MSATEAGQTRSFAMIGHAGDGKTTLADSILQHAGVTTRLGSVEDGSSYMNFLPEEQQRRLSISNSICSFEYSTIACCLIDTPGDPNFAGEIGGALMAVDHGLLVLSAQDGVKLGTEKAYRVARDQGVTITAVANKMDADRADYDRVASQLEETLGLRVVKLHLPLGSGPAYDGYIDLLNARAYRFKGGDSREPEISDVPADSQDDFEAAHLEMVEAIAEADDVVLERYLDEGQLSEEEITSTLRAGVLSGALLPLLSASASQGIGGSAVLRAVAGFFPSPEQAEDPKVMLKEDEIEISSDPDGPLVAYVFKSVADRYAGTLSLVRVYSGTLRSDMTLQNARTGTKERISKILTLSGETTHDIKEVGPGGVAAIPKLHDTRTGDSLGNERGPATVVGPDAPQGVISFAVEAANKGEEDKVFESLKRLVAEDPSLRLGRDQRTNESLITGLGQLHIEVTLEKLRRLFKVEVNLKPPKVPYMETIKGRADGVEGKLKKQTGGRGQFGQCILNVEPGERGSGVEFLDEIAGGAIPRGFIPAVEKGVRDACERGIIAGYPMTDIRIHCVDGKHHSVDSSEQAFRIAGSMGVRAAVAQARPILLEPIMSMQVSVPHDYVGDVMGNLNSRRGRVGGVDARGSVESISADVPMSEVLTYASDLTSITGGQGSFTMEFSHYQEVPKEVQEKIIAESQAAKDDD